MDPIEEKILHPDISKKLIELKEKDQRDIAIENNPDLRKIEVNKNTAVLKDVIDSIGWPTISKVGFEASGVAWLVAQHSDYDLDFQKHCLKLMKSEPEDEIRKQNIAYLIDRVRKNEGKPQLYGTQFMDSWILWEVEDPDKLDERRLSMGLSSMDEYIELSKERHKILSEKEGKLR